MKERMNEGHVSEFLWALSVFYNTSMASASIRGNLINLMSRAAYTAHVVTILTEESQLHEISVSVQDHLK